MEETFGMDANLAHMVNDDMLRQLVMTKALLCGIYCFCVGKVIMPLTKIIVSQNC